MKNFFKLPLLSSETKVCTTQSTLASDVLAAAELFLSEISWVAVHLSYPQDVLIHYSKITVFLHLVRENKMSFSVFRVAFAFQCCASISHSDAVKAGLIP